MEYDIWVRDLQRGAETLIIAEPGVGGFRGWQGNDRLVFVGQMGGGGGRTQVSQAASGAGRPEELGVQGILRNPSPSMDRRFVVFEALMLDGEIRPPEAGASRPTASVGVAVAPRMPATGQHHTSRPVSRQRRVTFISDASGTNEVAIPFR